MNRRDEKHAAPHISTGEWIRLEMKRYIEATEMPGKYGWFGEAE